MALTDLHGLLLSALVAYVTYLLFFSMADPFERFLQAQDTVDPVSGLSVYSTALAELQAGKKRSHWIWFIFPFTPHPDYRSSNHRHFALPTQDDVRAFLAHPVLGSRLRDCTRAVIDSLGRGHTLSDIFGKGDANKFRVCMRTFAEATGEELFSRALSAADGIEQQSDPSGVGIRQGQRRS